MYVLLLAATVGTRSERTGKETTPQQCQTASARSHGATPPNSFLLVVRARYVASARLAPSRPTCQSSHLSIAARRCVVGSAQLSTTRHSTTHVGRKIKSRRMQVVRSKTLAHGAGRWAGVERAERPLLHAALHAAGELHLQWQRNERYARCVRWM